MTQASICTIGDEILIGQVVDTNSSAIARSLNSYGIKTGRMLSVGDDREEIITSLGNELRHNDIVIVTGGLGPTKDDITKAALAELSGSSGWVLHQGQLDVVTRILHSRGLDMLDINRNQALVPDNCEVIVNKIGTAPVMVFRFDESLYGHPAVLYSLPGVPFEALAAMDDVISDIKSHYIREAISHRTLMTYGMAESALSKRIASWEDSLPENMHLAYLPDPKTGVRLRLSAYGGDRKNNEKLMEERIGDLSYILGDTIYSFKDDTLENAIGELLRKQGRTVSAAESCTGGNISAALSSVPGASEYYYGSVTSYNTMVKVEVLGVSQEVIDKYGVVSSETASAMADGVSRLLGTDYAVSTSGFAGPSGGTPENPVGTVWVGVHTPTGTFTKKFQYGNDRKRNTERFTASALNFLLQQIKKLF